MSERQYIGARYVPIFADPVEWDSVRTYEPLTIVTYYGTSYTSKKAVPAGTEISDTDYWVVTGNYNAQLETLIDLVSVAAKSYDTVADLINDIDNVSSGDIVNVYGFYDEGDGGASTILISDSEPDTLYITLDNKYGVVLNKGYVVPEMFGAYGDGIHDDSAIINSILAAYGYCHLVTGKTYKCSNTISISGNSSLFGHNAKIVTSASYGLTISNYTTTQDHTLPPKFITDLQLSGDGTNTLILVDKCLKSNIQNCYLTNFSLGIDFEAGYEMKFNNITLNAGVANATGIKCGASTNSAGGDSYFDQIVLRDCKIGVIVNSNGNYFTNIHAWLLQSAYIDGSFMFVDNTLGGFSTYYNNIYCDTYAHLIKKIGTGLAVFDKVKVMANTTIMNASGITESYIIVYDNDTYITYMGGKVCLYHLTITNVLPSLYVLANKTDVYIPYSVENIASDTFTMLNDFNTILLFNAENGATINDSKITIINNELHGFLDVSLPADWTTYKVALRVKNGGINFESMFHVMRKVGAAESDTPVSATTIGNYIQVRGSASTRWYVYLNASVRPAS